MNERLLKQIKEFIYELLYAKVVETFENASLSYGAVVELPALTNEEWITISAMSRLAGLCFNYSARESMSELLGIETMYRNAIDDYLINERKIHEVPGEFYSYSVCRSRDCGMLVLFDIDYWGFLTKYEATEVVIMQQDDNGHKRYFVQDLIKDPVKEEKSYTFSRELSPEEAQKLIQ